jgi:endonuclease VIII
VDAVRARLGPDPLRRDADPDRAWGRISRSRAPLATLLMDQSVLAGVGNVYRAEVLFRHQLDPLVPGCELRADQWAKLWPDLVELMDDGVRRGRIDTVRPEHDPVRTGRAPRQDRHGGEVYVYRRAGAPCLVCSTAVATTVHAGRKLYWCPSCQRRPVL